ncbi:hypothetical protein IOC61_16250 [Halomonas sp. KAO]|uniref:hypothetical protein n=1 Tax=unclassified Halomonas TaxID=2609666 RepID=UPI0018A111E1|nr:MULTISPECIES: hypothetical protein [unclassified Halomonas]MBF7054852.1 hypothetical protein [Halomonas sp. KAO]MDT0500355.1 hypothetical protein [Halomonas sp. PAR7]MDT0511148.1 hypothetical protein [Halomonas sp. LES1]MDT0590563.1 hypothetical protein [Halomonas sp. PAR8]
MHPFLVDVFAIHPRGQEQHLGGGIFHAASADDAEELATQEFWQSRLTDQGYDIGFRTDQPDTGWKVMSLESLQAFAPRQAYA